MKASATVSLRVILMVEVRLVLVMTTENGRKWERKCLSMLALRNSKC